MTTEQALLTALKSDPDNIETRMFFADWYEEHGDCDRAEFIRLQLALANLAPTHDWRRQYSARATALFQSNRKRWNAPLHRQLSKTPARTHYGARRAPVRGWKYRRGFVEVLITTVPGLVKYAKYFVPLGPILRLELRGAEEHIAELLKCPLLQQFREIDLSHNGLLSESIASLAASPALEQCTSLDLSGNLVHGDTFAVFARAGHLMNLKHLRLWGYNSTSNDVHHELTARFGKGYESTDWSRHQEREDRQPYDPEYDEGHSVPYDDNTLYDDGRAYANAGEERDWNAEHDIEGMIFDDDDEPDSEDDRLEGYGFGDRDDEGHYY